MTLIGGQICALLVLLVLQRVFLTNDEIRAWGWRIPFFIGALLAVVALDHAAHAARNRRF